MSIKIEGLLGKTVWDKATADKMIFPIKVIEVNGDRAIITTNGNRLEVTSQVPLKPGQELLVRKLGISEGTEKWQILCDRSEASAQLFFSMLGLSDDIENRVIANALSRAGLPITEENIYLNRLLLECIGVSTYHDLYAAIASIMTSLRFAIPWDFLLPLLKPFIDKVAIAQEPAEKDSQERKDEATQTEAIAHRIKDSLSLLQKTISCFATRLKSFSRDGICWNEEQRFLLGGQLLAWGQGRDIEHGGAYYYIPLLLPSGKEEHLLGEMLVFPKTKKRNRPLLSVVINLVTHHLGWIQVDLCLYEKVLKVKMLVEEQSTKELLDASWSELEERLKKKTRYVILWSGCGIGSVRSVLRGLMEDYSNPRVPKVLDLMI